MSRQEKAKTLVHQAKQHFHNKDMKGAAKAWCEIYDLYDETTAMESVAELHTIMALFTNEEVFGITDYLRNEYYKSQMLNKC